MAEIVSADAVVTTTTVLRPSTSAEYQKLKNWFIRNATGLTVRGYRTEFRDADNEIAYTTSYENPGADVDVDRTIPEDPDLPPRPGR